MIRPADDDGRLRAAAFAFLGQLAARDGVASWHDLQRFEFWKSCHGSGASK